MITTAIALGKAGPLSMRTQLAWPRYLLSDIQRRVFLKVVKHCASTKESVKSYQTTRKAVSKSIAANTAHCLDIMYPPTITMSRNNTRTSNIAVQHLVFPPPYRLVEVRMSRPIHNQETALFNFKPSASIVFILVSHACWLLTYLHALGVWWQTKLMWKQFRVNGGCCDSVSQFV